MPQGYPRALPRPKELSHGRAVQSIHPATPQLPPRQLTRSQISAKPGQRVPWHCRAGHSTHGASAAAESRTRQSGAQGQAGHQQHGGVGTRLPAPCPECSPLPGCACGAGVEHSPHPFRLQPPPALPQFPHPAAALTLYPRVAGTFPRVGTPMLAPAPLLPASPGTTRPGSLFVQAGPGAASPSSPLPEGSSCRWLHPIPALASLEQGAGSGLGSSTSSDPSSRIGLAGTGIPVVWEGSHPPAPSLAPTQLCHQNHPKNTWARGAAVGQQQEACARGKGRPTAQPPLRSTAAPVGANFSTRRMLRTIQLGGGCCSGCRCPATPGPHRAGAAIEPIFPCQHLRRAVSPAESLPIPQAAAHPAATAETQP